MYLYADGGSRFSALTTSSAQKFRASAKKDLNASLAPSILNNKNTL